VVVLRRNRSPIEVLACVLVPRLQSNPRLQRTRAARSPLSRQPLGSGGV
jgi:hypothetical protein